MNFYLFRKITNQIKRYRRKHNGHAHLGLVALEPRDDRVDALTELAELAELEGVVAVVAVVVEEFLAQVDPVL